MKITTTTEDLVVSKTVKQNRTVITLNNDEVDALLALTGSVVDRTADRSIYKLYNQLFGIVSDCQYEDKFSVNLNPTIKDKA